MDEPQSQSQNYLNQQVPETVGFSSSEKTPVSFPELKKKGNDSPLGLVIIIVVLALILGSGGFLLYANKDSLPFISASPTPTPTPLLLRASPTPIEESVFTPTPEPVKADTVDKDTISINVLNGTGIAGEAKVMRDYLVTLGYSDIAVGNASRQDYVVTEIIYSTNVPEALINELVSGLQKKYQEVKSKKGIPSKGDIEIIVGYKKGYSPSPTATSTIRLSPTITPTNAERATSTLTPIPTKSATLTPKPS